MAECGIDKTILLTPQLKATDTIIDLYLQSLVLMAVGLIISKTHLFFNGYMACLKCTFSEPGQPQLLNLTTTVYQILYTFFYTPRIMQSMPLLIILVPFETVKIMDRNFQICNKFES